MLFIAIAVTVVMLVGTFPEYALGTVVPFMDRGGPLNAGTVGIYTSIMFLAAGLMSLVMGKLVDTYPPVPLCVLLFVTVGCVMITLPSLSTSAHFMLFSVVGGGFLALSNPLTNRIIRLNVHLQSRPWVVGWKSVGPQLGALVAGLVYALSGTGWREASYGSAMAFFVLAGVFGVGLGYLLKPIVVVPSEPRVGVQPRPGKPENSIVYWLIPFSFFTSGAIATVGAYVPVFAHEILAFEPGRAGVAAAVVALASIFGRAIWIGACRWAPPIRLLMIGSLLASLSTTGLIAAPFVGEWVFWLSLVAIGLTAMGMSPLVQVIVIEASSPTRIGRSSALIGVGMYGGFAFQPVFMAQVMKLVGFANSWAVMGVSNLLGIAVLALYGWSRNRTPVPPFGDQHVSSEAGTGS